MSRRVAFATLGCKVNQVETEALKELFRSQGYSVMASFDLEADVYIINTCTVTSVADRKCRQLVRRARRQSPQGVIAVVGCWPQTSLDKALAMPEIDVVAGTLHRRRTVELVEEFLQTGERQVDVSAFDPDQGFEELPLDYSTHVRAFLKVQDGCNQFCSYCIIPYARGPVRSRAPEQIIIAARQLVAYGYKEIVLTGIHLGLYGSDFPVPADLRLILGQLEEVDGLERIRISSLDPAEITDELLEMVAASPKICPHLHVPLQSGSPGVLRRMRRPYKVDHFLHICERIRSLIPDVGLSTDVIVGFPGETDKDFAETLAVTRQAAFSRLHVFPYSARPGTPAAGFPDQVPAELKKSRAAELTALGQSLALDFHRSAMNRPLAVLVEEETESGILSGYSGNYIRARFPGQRDLINKVVELMPCQATDEYVLGNVIQ